MRLHGTTGFSGSANSFCVIPICFRPVTSPNRTGVQVTCSFVSQSSEGFCLSAACSSLITLTLNHSPLHFTNMPPSLSFSNRLGLAFGGKSISTHGNGFFCSLDSSSIRSEEHTSELQSPYVISYAV